MDVVANANGESELGTGSSFCVIVLNSLLKWKSSPPGGRQAFAGRCPNFVSPTGAPPVSLQSASNLSGSGKLFHSAGLPANKALLLGQLKLIAPPLL